ncbi:hypothetical protein TRFO_41421 [Tritrichomonas foetus]|uniref:Leucine Rich Repeat family protein n=1 Tax=Tritrichomonas foetus TaxID=1144522 RepID=A0A1J4L0D0_9EUKA|nr:hypothetical protein TRFO_41421 [Tritrichomonas foetus]|eukprot:OHT16969.1 hypothetical protein TRFO_41421 [Tritrichomonas foetus]
MEENHELDLRGKSLETLSSDDIPLNTRDLYCSNNKLTILPSDIFHGKSKIWNIDLSYNSLINLDFLLIFNALGTLDLRHNSLMIDEVIQLREIHILHLYLDDNNFQKFTGDKSLAIPALLKRAWTIDGIFISDNIKKRAKEYRDSLAFSEGILAARRKQTSAHQKDSVSNLVSTFLGGNTCSFNHPMKFKTPEGITLSGVTKKPQIERLAFLSKTSHFILPEGDFYDYFGIALGILSVHWLNVNIALIPRVISRAYWSLISEDLLKLENWEQWIVLSMIDERIKSDNQKEIDIWNKVNLAKYLMFGNIPKLGTFPRLLICSIIYRNADITEEILNSEDMKIYLKFRSSGTFGSPECDFDSIHYEMLADLPVNANRIPKKNDIVAIRHPYTDEWVNSIVAQVGNGRVVLKVDDFFQQMTLNSMFWDGRGVFRENKRADDNLMSSSLKKSTKTFITIVDSIGDSESVKQDVTKFAVPLPPCAIPAKNVIPRDDPSFFLRAGQNMLNTSPFIDRKKRASSQFRGIVDPLPPKRKTHVRAAPTRRPTQIVDSVVNISLGQEVGPGRRLRKFHVRVVSTSTKKPSYVWINEDEIPPEDVQRLLDLYRKHIESKMIIIPGI